MIPANLEYSNTEEKPQINDRVSVMIEGEDIHRQGRLVTDGINTYVVYRKLVNIKDIKELKFKEAGERLS